MRLGLGKDRGLDLGLLGAGLDHQIGAGQPVAAWVGDQPVERVAGLKRGEIHALAQLARGRQRTADLVPIGIRKGGGLALDCAPAGDGRPHGAGSDDMDVGDTVLLRHTGFQSFAQVEDADQVPRRVGGQMPREGSDLGRLLRAAVGPFWNNCPDGMWRRPASSLASPKAGSSRPSARRGGQ